MPAWGTQRNWRWCDKCQGLWFAGGASQGKCPAGGTHAKTGSGIYSLVRQASPTPPNHEANWRWCNKCQGLWFAGNQTAGKCPAGGGHVASVAGTPLDYANVCKRVWVPARDAAGIDGSEVGAFHAFRHTLGSLIHERGAKSDRQLCDWLGHHDPAFTVREYVGTMDDGLGEADFLDELIPVEVWGAGR